MDRVESNSVESQLDAWYRSESSEYDTRLTGMRHRDRGERTPSPVGRVGTSNRPSWSAPATSGGTPPETGGMVARAGTAPASAMAALKRMGNSGLRDTGTCTARLFPDGGWLPVTNTSYILAVRVAGQEVCAGSAQPGAGCSG